MKAKGKSNYLKQNKVFINSDLTKKERGIQKTLRDRAAIETAKGNAARVGYQYIIINGIKHSWNKKENKIEEIENPINIEQENSKN
ncbi:unnamed protein product [Acanthoscelides obtectus]|uniref:Uncharacterized protein n=1 Tax=Acanthoscelides obtectus TaxID=200917 RepID=A0A9P0KNB6_ACAOB|nr:unnamed protein product [Acanthoscelides obtectus]CAK1682093.1 hypothetical protein AOBTE_LOCUS33422 [Acanthoscelides obtectus]